MKLINEARRMQQLAGLIKESQLNEGVSEWEITDDDEIEGGSCIDFNPKELKEGDIVYKKITDVSNYTSSWTKDINKFNASFSTPDKYKVISNDGKILKLEEQ